MRATCGSWATGWAPRLYWISLKSWCKHSTKRWPPCVPNNSCRAILHFHRHLLYRVIKLMTFKMFPFFWCMFHRKELHFTLTWYWKLPPNILPADTSVPFTWHHVSGISVQCAMVIVINFSVIRSFLDDRLVMSNNLWPSIVCTRIAYSLCGYLAQLTSGGCVWWHHLVNQQWLIRAYWRNFPIQSEIWHQVYADVSPCQYIPYI